MKRAIVLTVASLLILCMSAVAQGKGPITGPRFDGCRFGQDGPGFRGHGFGDGERHFGRILQMADEIGLTQEQKDAVLKMQKTFGNERIDRKANLEKAELELRNLRLSNAGDSEILAAMDKVGRFKTDMQKMRFRHQQAMDKVLTDEQRDKLKEMRKQRYNKDCPFTPGEGPRDGSGAGPGPGMGRQGRI